MKNGFSGSPASKKTPTSAPISPLVSLSNDPAYDTPARLQRFARERGVSGNWMLLTGAEADMSRLLTRFNLAGGGGRRGGRSAAAVLAALAAHPHTNDATSPGGIKALAHITGGGLLENIPRVLPDGLAAHLTHGSWPQTELFAWLQKTAAISDIEMNRTFNNGIGMVVVVGAAEAESCAATLRGLGETVYTIGTIAPQGSGAQVVVA